jgi:hypothetical protein
MAKEVDLVIALALEVLQIPVVLLSEAGKTPQVAAILECAGEDWKCCFETRKQEGSKTRLPFWSHRDPINLREPPPPCVSLPG